MAKDKADKTPSADEIIEALALEMGVDDQVAAKAAQPASEPDEPVQAEEPSAAATAPAPAEPAAPKPAAPKPAVAPKPAPAKAGVPKPAPPRAEAPPAAAPRPAAPKPAPAKATAAKPAAADRPAPPERPRAAEGEPAEVADYDDEHVIDRVFHVTKKEPDAYVGDYYEDNDEAARRLEVSKTYRRSAVMVGIVLAVTGAILFGIYLAIPQEYRQDIGPLLRGVDIQSERRERRQREAEEARRAWLESQPKYGTLTILTRPGFARVTLEGLPEYVRHPANEGWLVETRSGTTFNNLDIRNQYLATISLPNFVEEQIPLYPWGHPDSLWQQHPDDGTYYLEMNELLTPEEDAATELQARMQPTVDTPDLNGTITVRTNPPGATVYYNNRMLVDAHDQPLVTPLTFNSYPPPPPVPEGSGVQAEATPASTEPIPVTLRATGVPLRVELDGYMPVATGVYRHMFICEPVEHVPDTAPFWQHCNYTYDTGEIELVRPEDFHMPGEGSGEGSGQGAAATGTASSG